MWSEIDARISATAAAKNGDAAAQSRFVRRVGSGAVSFRSRARTINERYADRSDYLKAVLEAGGIRAYERQHRTTLANVLNRGTRLPADVIPKIVDYWAHVGWYAIEKDEREYMYSDSELDEEGSFGS